MENQKLKSVKIEQQEKMGIVRRQNYVTAQPEMTTALARVPRAEVMPQTPVHFEVTPTATSHIEMKTSAQDRAIGFLIASMPRTFAFSLAVTLASIVLGGVTLAASLVILFGTFSIVELASYIYTLAVSAEGVAFYEAKQKWAVIKREQSERWNHYNGGK